MVNGQQGVYNVYPFLGDPGAVSGDGEKSKEAGKKFG